MDSMRRVCEGYIRILGTAAPVSLKPGSYVECLDEGIHGVFSGKGDHGQVTATHPYTLHRGE